MFVLSGRPCKDIIPDKVGLIFVSNRFQYKLMLLPKIERHFKTINMKINLIILLLVVVSFSSCAQTEGVKQLTSVEASKMIAKDKNLLVLDVRTPEEFSAGHIQGAININIKQPDALSKIDALDRNATYIVHCRTNHRSKIAVDHMQQSEFKNIYQISDGYNGWSQNNLPEVK
jgi:phage shock protein E